MTHKSLKFLALASLMPLIAQSTLAQSPKTAESFLLGKWTPTEINGEDMRGSSDYWLFKPNGTMIEHIFDQSYERRFSVRADTLYLTSKPEGICTPMAILDLNSQHLELSFFEGSIHKKMVKASPPAKSKSKGNK